MNPELLSFLSSLLGGRAMPRRHFTDPFSSPVPSLGNVLEAHSEAVPMVPLRRLLGMRSLTEFKRAPYLEAGFRGVIPALIDECLENSMDLPNILYPYYFAPLANKDGFYHLRSSDGAPLVKEPLRGVRGNHPFGDGWNSRYVVVKIQEPVGYPTCWRTVDVSHPVSFAGEAVANLIIGIPRRFRWVTFLVSREALRHSRVSGNVTRSRASVVFDEYQKVKAWRRRLSYTPPPRLARAALSAGGLSSISSTSTKIMPNRDLLTDAHRRLTSEALLLRGLRRLSYTPPPRLARAALSAGGLSSISSTSAEIMPDRDLLADAHQRLTSEALLLRGQVQDMMACRDLLIQQVRASARWELMKEWLEKRVDHWNPEEEYRHHLFLSGGFNHRSEDLSQAATPRFDIGSRFSEGPSF
ncbi:hypothetical protein DY000_02047847 [Brassica cretica]|uniref:Uncharacterized protein n=1 Tax=Brassica cretica TaxID=69181 RepID=A0ABQ7ESM7_BRACR|nr:hypothetical protein DY000_02047847 [Brassica cretica]